MRSATAVLVVLKMCLGLLEIPVYRLIQYDYEGVSLGSQVSSLNFLGAYYNTDQEVPRKIALVHGDALSLETLENIISLKPSAILIILSEPLTKEIQSYLGFNTFHFPVYAAHETEELLNVYKELQATGEQTIDSDQLQFSVTADEKPVVKNLQQENYYGFVYEYSEALPTIALVTYYDAFSVFPELTNGTDANGSGVVALISLLKLFKKLYAQSPAPYNLLFILTASGTTNFQGLKHFLNAEEQELQLIRGGISFALCLDAIGKGEKLVMHVSRFHKEGENDIINIYSQFNTTATKHGIPLYYNKKKVNMADPFTPWQHEAFAKSKIVSASLSHFEESKASIVDHSSFMDSGLNINTLQKNIKYVSETLIKFLYGFNETTIPAKIDFINSSYILDLVNEINQFNRFPTKLTPGSKYLLYLQKLINGLEINFKVQKFAATEVTLYNSKKEILSVYKVKPAMLDLYLFLAILTYLAVLWGVIKLSSKTSSKDKKNS